MSQTYAFIDSQNLKMGIRSQGWRLDYGKFRIYLRNKYGVTKAFIFLGYIAKNKTVYKKLEKEGYILIFKKVLAIKRNHRITYKGNVDAELVLNTMINLKNFDKAIIVSGDGDFYCLIEYLAQNKKLAKVIAPNKKYSSLLRKYAKYIASIGNKNQTLGAKKRGIPAANKVNLW